MHSFQYLNSDFMPRTIADFLKELPLIPDPGGRASKIHDFVDRLQEEMKKIDAFKRELPLCMLLLNDGIEALKEAASHVNSSAVSEPVLAEFIPLSGCSREDEEQKLNKAKNETDPKDKKNWMISVQLWNADHHHDGSSAQVPLLQPQYKKQEGRAFIAFKGTRNETVTSGIESKVQLKEQRSSSGSGLGSGSVPHVRMVRGKRSVSGSMDAAPPSLRSPGENQLPRKQRRYWAPELHRQFVNALEKLGGPQAATPKQIRELMQVDGLTNDEVKSHLQKYRLHTRRLPNTKHAYPSNRSAVLGDLWVNHGDKCGESSKVSDSQSRSPQGPFQLANNKSRTSFTGGDSIDEEDENEGRSWKSRQISETRKG